MKKMNNKSTGLLLSIFVIGVAASLAGAGTLAYFSDVETSEGNTFSAGTLDLKIDLSNHSGVIFDEKDLTAGDRLFDLPDIKPGHSGEVTVSLHVYGSDACGKIIIGNLSNDENGCNEPEADVDDTCGNPGSGEGELAQNLNFTLWEDMCSEGECQPGDNVYTAGCDELIFDGLFSDIIDGYTYNIPEMLQACTVYYYGIAWSVDEDVGNVIQSDSLTCDIAFEVTDECLAARDFKIDVKPGSCPNPFNVIPPCKGDLPIALLGTFDYPVDDLDPTSVRVWRNGIGGNVAPLRYSYEDTATPFYPTEEECCHDLTGDGIEDLNVKFDRPALIDDLRLCEIPDKTEIYLTVTVDVLDDAGSVIDTLVGSDCVLIRCDHHCLRELPVYSLPILIIIIDTDFTDLHRRYCPD